MRGGAGVAKRDGLRRGILEETHWLSAYAGSNPVLRIFLWIEQWEPSKVQADFVVCPLHSCLSVLLKWWVSSNLKRGIFREVDLRFSL